MSDEDLDFTVSHLGEPRIPSPMRNASFVVDDQRVLFHSDLGLICGFMEKGIQPPQFETAGPREKIYFDPSKLKCGIVTCGGLCPGLNDVIRAIVLALIHHYGVKTIFGFRFGFEGLTYRHGHVPLELTPTVVEEIHKFGGSILGSSRGPQDISEMTDTLERMNVGLLFTIGGDGTLRGAQAIAEEIGRRGLKIGIVGIPKTIDNDISFVGSSFGFETAVAESRTAIYSAHAEAVGARNGIGLVKLMGRESGFIAANAALANNDVNFCLVPEVDFSLEGFLKVLEKRLSDRGHAVVVVGEGAGQTLMKGTGERDASGNPRFSDVGIFLKNRINEHFRKLGIEVNLKYIDPSYTIRSLPANPRDSAFCLRLGHNAVHAGMTGRTNMLVGFWKGEFTHVPIQLATSSRKRIDPNGRLWSDVLSSTGQPRVMD
ncbi:MAG: diphosphate--fructose-6-phosphate 1-phosphotransferase [Deltaproteobacteria bacterium HGW-Deltaproteobacteria-21]|nr:MAG: diphosphate--fructose-6-phosphate 1-phosphotransferase [Deltaproteobacteria bacterium HGW-Deltaproteobacteria-21]